MKEIVQMIPVRYHVSEENKLFREYKKYCENSITKEKVADASQVLSKIRISKKPHQKENEWLRTLV